MFFDKKYEGKGWELKDGVLTIRKEADLENEHFKYRDDIVKVCLPEGLEKIPQEAFKDCTNLKTINIPESVERIDLFAFWGCKSLRDITIPANSYCIIDSDVFAHCTGLEKVTLGAGVDVVGSGVFEDCNNLKRIDFGDSQPWLWSKTFDGVPDDVVIGYKGLDINVKDLRELLADYNLDPIRLSDVDFTGTQTTKEKDDKGWELKDGVLTIHKEQYFDFRYEKFENCDELTALHLPDGLKRIPSEVYYNNSYLSNIYIPETVEIIENNAFSNCPSLKSITLPDKVRDIGSCAFCETGLESIKIPQNVKSIESLAFGLCKDLKKVTIENDKLPEIPDQSFTDCKNLESINIPESVERIGDGAFFRCESLREITIQSTAHCVIDKHAFEDCKNLKKVTLGVGVDSLKPGAFQNCSSLRRVEIANDQPRIWDKAFEGVPDDAVIACNGREISLKDLNKIWDEREASDPILKLSVFYDKKERTPINLSVKDIDDYIAKQAEKEKKPEKKKHAYRGR